MKTGIIGLPGSGKTTIFEALTKSPQDSAGKMEARIGVIPVPDKRIDILSDMYNPRKTIYAQVEYFLPAKQGQKKDAANSMWNQVRDCDALVHVIRNFKSYGQDASDPAADFAEMEQELILADQVVVEKRLERIEHEKKRGKKSNPEELALLDECLKMLEAETPLRKNPEIADAQLLRGFCFLTAKPKLVLFNNDDDDDDYPDVGALTSQEECLVMRGKIEQEISQMSEEEAEEFLSDFGIKAPAMDRVVSKTYEVLGLVSFFTVGEDEVRAWTITRGTEALDAAEVIHSDIKKGFIRAECVSYNDLMDAESYNEAKKRGAVRLEGKTYVVQDGDIINFRFNV